eukprot:15489-Heterococcus_DN1.PRE.1
MALVLARYLYIAANSYTNAQVSKLDTAATAVYACTLFDGENELLLKLRILRTSKASTNSIRRQQERTLFVRCALMKSWCMR